MRRLSEPGVRLGTADSRASVQGWKGAKVIAELPFDPENPDSDVSAIIKFLHPVLEEK